MLVACAYNPLCRDKAHDMEHALMKDGNRVIIARLLFIPYRSLIKQKGRSYTHHKFAISRINDEACDSRKQISFLKMHLKDVMTTKCE